MGLPALDSDADAVTMNLKTWRQDGQRSSTAKSKALRPLAFSARVNGTSSAN